MKYVYRVTGDKFNKVLMTEQAWLKLENSGSYKVVKIKLTSVKASERIMHYWRDHDQLNDSSLAWDYVSKNTVKRWADYLEHDVIYAANVIAVDFKRRVKLSA